MLQKSLVLSVFLLSRPLCIYTLDKHLLLHRVYLWMTALEQNPAVSCDYHAVHPLLPPNSGVETSILV